MERAFRASTATITEIEAEERPLARGALGVAPGEGLVAGEAENLVRRLARELLEGSPRARVRAAGRLVELLGMEASSLISVALQEAEDPELIMPLCLALGRTGDPEALDGLLAHAAHDDPKVRAAAWEAAITLSPEEVQRELIEQCLQDPASTVRRRALMAVASLPGVDPGPWAARCLRDVDPQVRRLACVALGATRDERSARRLLGSLEDVDETVRTAARSAAHRLFGERLPTHGLQAAAGTPSQRAPAKQVAEAPDLEPLVSVETSRAPSAESAEVSAPASHVEPASRSAGSEATIPFAVFEAPLLAAIRGLTSSDLAAQVGRELSVVEASLERHLAEGRVVRRGRKVFLP